MSANPQILNEYENFLGIRPLYSSPATAPFIIIPAPLERSTSFGKGTELGPRKILEASRQVEFYDQQLLEEPFRRGIATLAPLIFAAGAVEVGLSQISEKVRAVRDGGKIPIVIGGEHTVTAGAVQGLKSSIDSFSILQLDAHSDCRDEYEGDPYSHASVMKRVWEIQPSMTLCGIRSQCIEETDFIARNAIPIYYAHQLQMVNSWEPVIETLLPNVYLTIDCDFFDPSVMPAVGTPEPGGFGWIETLAFISLLVKQRNIIGFDVVELSPRPGLFYADFMAAKLIYKLIGYLGRKNAQRFPIISE